MRRSLRIAWFVAGSVALLGTVAWIDGRAAPDQGSRVSSDDVGEAGRPMRFVTGDRALYDLGIRTEVRPRSASGATAALVQSVRGVLDVEVLGCDTEDVNLSLRLHGAELEVNGRRDPRIDARLALPFFARLSREGRLLDCVPPPECSPREGELLVEVLAELQWLIPATADREWEREEEHAGGRYAARYGRDAQGGMTKTKCRYAESQAGRRTDVLDSRGEARLAVSGSWLESLAGEEQIVVRTPIETFQARTTVRLARLPESSRATLSRVLERAARTPVEPASDSLVTRTEPLTGEIEARLHDVLSAIDAADRPRASDRIALRELFTACPELAGRVPQMLLEGSWQERARSAVLHALEIVGSPAAQSALAATLADPAQSDADRLRAVIASAGLADPGLPVVVSLRTLATAARTGPARADLTAAARLALGSVARGLEDHDPGRAAAMRAELLQALARADAEDVTVLIGALGNTGAAELVPRLSEYLDSPNAHVAVAAASALGRIDDESSLEPLRGLVARSRDPHVRAAAVRALGRLSFTTPSSVATVEEQLAQETDEPVRLAMTAYLADRLEGRPELRPVLEAVARAPGSQRTRRAAGDALAAEHARSR